MIEDIAFDGKNKQIRAAVRMKDADDNSSEFAQLDRTINEIERYEKGWDGYNGSQFDFETIKRVKQILSVIQKYYASIGSLPDEICPGPASDGSVDIEISHENRHFIFTIYPDERQINYYYQYGDDKRDGEISFSKPDLANWISGGKIDDHVLLLSIFKMLYELRYKDKEQSETANTTDYDSYVKNLANELIDEIIIDFVELKNRDELEKKLIDALKHSLIIE